ncbi:MAG: helicase, putative, RecD/TraA family, partial [Oscillospiraceae bacterium]|nr:helicase, putative, RecD/TraA family [Oscillospiraceae bacterium]
WGVMAVEMVKDNPYALCNNEFEINFATADDIAKEMEVPTDSVCRIKAALSYVLIKNLSNGHTCLPEDKLVLAAYNILNVEENLIETVLKEEIEKSNLYAIDRGKLYIYLPVMITAESYITSRLTLMVGKPPEEEDSLDTVIDIFEGECNIEYATLQRKAIKQALINQVMILTGGPGTGKTTTLNAIIELLEQQGNKVLIAAPTGRAAKRISEVTGKEAKTIHRLLEVEFGEHDRINFSRNERNMLDCSVVVVDEMSMIDTLLFDSLLRAMPLKCKLVMVGDSDQLPSVGAGNVLKDLIDSNCIPTVQLTQIFRQAAQSLIVTNAHSIVRGNMPNTSQKDNDFFFMQRIDPLEAQKTVMELCANRLPASYGFNPFDDIQVLCPSRKGELGVIELNKKLQQELNPKSSEKAEFSHNFYTFREGDKVMQIKNNYDISWMKEDEKGLGIFNGDIGIVRMIDKSNRVMCIDFDLRIAYYTFEMANELELAYAITVHKSQGSEFNAIVIPILGGFDKLYFRNLLYTAVTRAKKILIIVGSKKRLEYMVSNNRKMLRYTGLGYFLSNGMAF